MQFDPQAYGQPAALLISNAPPPPLGPGTPQAAVLPSLAALDHSTLFGGRTVVDSQMADCCLSGLWLLFGFLDESHTISQSIGSTSGSFWHGIMHRREPDYSNAKYWFRRVGHHPVFEPLHRGALQIAGDHPHDRAVKSLAETSNWDPFRFVDLCESAGRESAPASDDLLRQVAYVEWQLLFDYCYQHAVA